MSQLITSFTSNHGVADFFCQASQTCLSTHLVFNLEEINRRLEHVSGYGPDEEGRDLMLTDGAELSGECTWVMSPPSWFSTGFEDSGSAGHLVDILHLVAHCFDGCCRKRQLPLIRWRPGRKFVRHSDSRRRSQWLPWLRAWQPPCRCISCRRRWRLRCQICPWVFVNVVVKERGTSSLWSRNLLIFVALFCCALKKWFIKLLVREKLGTSECEGLVSCSASGMVTVICFCFLLCAIFMIS